MTVNYSTLNEGCAKVQYRLDALQAAPANGAEDCFDRVKAMTICPEQFEHLYDKVRYINATERFADVIKTFDVPAGETPAGFRVDCTLQADGVLAVDLVRDISYDKNSVKRPTRVIFSADSANPYEVAPIAPLLGNLTCNPGIVYDLFINNPKANVGGLFKTRDEVMAEIGRVLGPGCDISVELNNPFEKDFDKILDECEKFREMLTPYRLVIKVPHMGCVNGENVSQLLDGDKRLDLRYDEPRTEDAFRSHNLALRLREHGYRINYTLMFEPYQTALALQAKPYFINSFIRHRAKQSGEIKRLLDFYDMSGDKKYIEELRSFLISTDYLHKNEGSRDLLDVIQIGRDLLEYRKFDDAYGADGLDGVRSNLRWLRQSNLPDTRLILCSMEGAYNYPDIDRLLCDPEYQDVIGRVVLTAEPGYLARFTSANQVVSYQRRFMNAAKGQK